MDHQYYISNNRVKNIVSLTNVFIGLIISFEKLCFRMQFKQQSCSLIGELSRRIGYSLHLFNTIKPCLNRINACFIYILRSSLFTTITFSNVPIIVYIIVCLRRSYLNLKKSLIDITGTFVMFGIKQSSPLTKIICFYLMVGIFLVDQNGRNKFSGETGLRY